MPPKKAPKSGRPGRIPLYKGILWLCTIALIGSIASAYYFFKWPSSPQFLTPPLYEEPPNGMTREIQSPPQIPGKETTGSPGNRELKKIAIVIDDLGYDRQIALEFIELSAPLTLSFLPQAPYAKEMALLAKERGKEVLLHLPMEPHKYPETNPGPGAFLINMSEEEIRRTLEQDLLNFPFVAGANNHMGSRFTENREKMALIFEALKKQNMFFLDSLTTPHSVGPGLAREFRLPYIQRNIFLDNEINEGPIKQQLQKLVLAAQTNGASVGSAHPYPLLLKVIRDSLPGLQKQIQIVSLSKLIQ